MSLNIYESIMTRNGKLAKFFDENDAASKLVMKLIRTITNIAEENKISAEQLDYQVFCPKGGDVIVIRLLGKNKSITV